MPHGPARSLPPRLSPSGCLSWRPRPCARDLSLTVWLRPADVVLHADNHKNSRLRRAANAINGCLCAMRRGLHQKEGIQSDVVMSKEYRPSAGSSHWSSKEACPGSQVDQHAAPAPGLSSKVSMLRPPNQAHHSEYRHVRSHEQTTRKCGGSIFLKERRLQLC